MKQQPDVVMVDVRTTLRPREVARGALALVVIAFVAGLALDTSQDLVCGQIGGIAALGLFLTLVCAAKERNA